MAAVITFGKGLAALAVLAGFSAQALAQTISCPSGSPLSASDITTLLGSKTVCASSGGDRWQEFHSGTGGALIDYKKGPNDPVDPTTQVGTWGASASGAGYGQVTYNYTDGGTSTYRFAVCAVSNSSATGTFVPLQSGSNIPFTLISGQSACP